MYAHYAPVRGKGDDKNLYDQCPQNITVVNIGKVGDNSTNEYTIQLTDLGMDYYINNIVVHDLG